jgi:NADPH:quinone reductase-like Zn-dependent oxidoreductase
MKTMNAVVMRRPGGPEVLRIERVPVPMPIPGQVLIRVKAFGLNRSELFTRQGHSPGVAWPRVLGIEAVGIVEDAPAGEFAKGQVVATAMGGMGRQFDGGYGEFTCVPAAQVQAIETRLPWDVLGALPEMLQTAWGALFKALRLKSGERLLVRGGTTSVGLAAAAIARRHGAIVAATSRDPQRQGLLRSAGVQHALVDSGAVADPLRNLFAEGADKVLELVGTTTLQDSLRCVRDGGVVCMAGMVGNRWTVDGFEPMGWISTGTCLTTYAGTAQDFMATPLQELADEIASGALPVKIGKTFDLAHIVDAHRAMEENRAEGKIVVLT